MSQTPPYDPLTGPASVVAVVVAHDGMQWLPDVLDGLAGQSRLPAVVVAVDTGSSDGSAQLLGRRLGEDHVARRSPGIPLGEAVAAGIETAAGLGADAEWVWILHDDSAPEPPALAALLARADGSPSTWVVAPKSRDWTGTRLIEFGATTDRSGHRETGVDPRELDQGQADLRTEALAAGTAGLLLRRSAWDRLGGFDGLGWPFADDIDLGWRVHAAGGRVALAPEAVVRHAAALTTGVRLTVRSDRRLRRIREMQVVIANTGRPWRTLLWLRFVLGAPLRALGLLLLRRLGAAEIELVAAAGLVAQRRRVTRAARSRDAERVVRPGDLRPLLAGLDARIRRLRDTTRAVPGRRDGGVHRYVETGPVDEASESLAADDGAALRRLVTRPGVAVFLLAAVVAVVAERHLFAGDLGGGRLLPAPAGAADLWAQYVAGFHPFGVGSSAPAPPAVALLAALSTLLLGKAWLAVDLIVLGAVPLSAASAWLAARQATDSTRLRWWAASAWALLPAVTGAVAGGRIDVCALAVLLPLAGRSLIRTLARQEPGQPGRWTACAATGLMLAVTAAWAPVILPLLLLSAAVAVLVAGAGRRRQQLAALIAIGVVALACCEPWSLSLLVHPADALAGIGLPDVVHGRPLPAERLLLLQPGGPAQPALWTGAALLLAAVVGAARGTRATRTGVAALAVGLAGAVAVSRLHEGSGTPAGRAWVGPALLLAGGGAILAAVAGAAGARAAMARRTFGLVQPVAVAVAVLAVAAVGWSGVSWLVRGAARPLTVGLGADVPLFVGDSLQAAASPRALVVSGSHPLAVAVVRTSAGPNLATGATASIPPSATEQSADAWMRAALADLVAGRRSAAGELARADVGFVVASGRAAAVISRGAAAAGGYTVTPSAGSLVFRAIGPVGEAVLSDGDPDAGAATGRVTVLPATAAGVADTQVAAVDTARTVLLAEPASSQWQLRVGSRVLPAVTEAGWQETWVLPAGVGGRIAIGWNDTSRAIWLWVELGLVVVALITAVPIAREEITPQRGPA